MSEEKVPEVQEALESDTAGEEAEDETPLKTPKRKFVMTPARLENLRKGREKRAENVRKKKAIEKELKNEEKSQKQAIKKRVEEEFAKVKEVAPEPVSEGESVESEDSESDTDTEEERVAAAPVPAKRQPRRATVQPSQSAAKKSVAPPQHVVLFI